MNDADAPLILLPGMGADARMFAPLQTALPQLITPNSQSILEELRATGDRSRLPLATQQF